MEREKEYPVCLNKGDVKVSGVGLTFPLEVEDGPELYLYGYATVLSTEKIKTFIDPVFNNLIEKREAGFFIIGHFENFMGRPHFVIEKIKLKVFHDKNPEQEAVSELIRVMYKHILVPTFLVILLATVGIIISIISLIITYNYV